MVDLDSTNHVEKQQRSIGTPMTKESTEQNNTSSIHESTIIDKKVPLTTGITLKTELVDSSIIEGTDSIKNKKNLNKHSTILDESFKEKSDGSNGEDSHMNHLSKSTAIDDNKSAGLNSKFTMGDMNYVNSSENTRNNGNASSSMSMIASNVTLPTKSEISHNYSDNDTIRSDNNKYNDNNIPSEVHNNASHINSNASTSTINNHQADERPNASVDMENYEEDDDGNKTIDLEAVHEDEKLVIPHNVIDALEIDPSAYSKSLRNKKSILIDDNDLEASKSVLDSAAAKAAATVGGSLVPGTSSSGAVVPGSSSILGSSVPSNPDPYHPESHHLQTASSTVGLLNSGAPNNNVLSSQGKSAVNNSILSGNNTVNGTMTDNLLNTNIALGNGPTIHATNGIANNTFSDVNSIMTSHTQKELPNASLKIKNKQKSKKPASSRADIFEAQVEGVLDDNNVTSDILKHDEINKDLESLQHVPTMTNNTPHSSISAHAVGDPEVMQDINITSNNSIHNSNSISDIGNKLLLAENNNELIKTEITNSEPMLINKAPSIVDDSSNSGSPNNRRHNSGSIKNYTGNLSSVTTATMAAAASPAKHPPPPTNYNFINFSATMNDMIEDNHNFYDELDDFDRRTYRHLEENSSTNSNVLSNTEGVYGHTHVNSNKNGNYRVPSINDKNSSKTASKKKKKGRSHSYYDDSRFIKDPRYLDLYRQQQSPSSHMNHDGKVINGGNSNINKENNNNIDVNSNSSDSESDYNTDDFKYQNFTKYKQQQKQQQLPNRRSVSYYTNNGKRKSSASKFNVPENDAFYKRRGHNLGNSKDKPAASTSNSKYQKNAVLLNMDNSNINKKISMSNSVSNKNTANKSGDNDAELRTTISKLFDSHGKNFKRYHENNYYDDDDIDNGDDDSYIGEELDDKASLLNYDYYNNYNTVVKNPKRNDTNINGTGFNLGNNNKRNSRIIKNRIIYKRPRSNFQTMKNVCWTIISILILLSFGFLWGFILASTKNLEDVSIKNINHIVVSNDELIFDIKCEGTNPGFGLVSIEKVDLDLFVKTSYLNFMDIETFFIGTIETLEYPLLFPGNLFKTVKMSESESTIKLIDPGTNSTKPSYDEDNGNTKELKRKGIILQDDDDSNLDKWKKSIKHPFELIVRGKFSYILPFSSSTRAISVYKSVNIDPSATYLI